MRKHRRQGEEMAQTVEYVLAQVGEPGKPAVFRCDDPTHSPVPENLMWSHAKRMHGTDNYNRHYPFEADQRE
jgi:hypothetical protein